ncbi:hypothetical protein [Dyadobacter sp. CY356]|uniref:hypothetical protein n=1 Tax=Dyadobacter sp. CY356 TaxID=2906442 RepID=UPI001F2A1663|nr:hypothetical protein [Dyadobacter sp. CY356]MCF0055302.1 hypothetical protein [Dyadobacter sp. CY356]
MSVQDSPKTSSGWEGYEKIALRTALIYAVISTIPFTPEFYTQDFDAGFNVNSYFFRWFDAISQNKPWFFASQEGKNYTGWFITVLVCAVAGFLWNILDKNRKDYEKLHYWFYVAARYGIALRMSWFAWAKVFPVQMPFPTISQLNTNLGDFTPGKLYWLTTGVSPFFEVFAGVFELLATILLLSRRTTTAGALMMIAILVPIWFVNIGYDAGVELTSLHILSLSLLLLVRDSKKFYQILIEHKAVALTYVPEIKFHSDWKNKTRLVLKYGFILIFIVYRGFGYGNLYANGKSFKLPLDDGLADVSGFYDVSEFKINNQIIPYSAGDTLRWQNVIFEKFNSISVKIDKPFQVNTKNSVRTTEFYGSIGRYYYGYKADTVKQIFTLFNRADTASKLVLHYDRPDEKHFVLSGINERADSVYVVLTKIDKKYPLAQKRK